jgi:hypothetical protein
MITLPFKTVSPLFEMEKSGEQPFTYRKIDYLDSRFAILKQRMDRPDIASEIAIAITNQSPEHNCTRALPFEFPLATVTSWRRSNRE